MKVYLSVDIEGIAGITHWDDADKKHPDYPEFREEMTREALAACEGAMAAGATEILIKDAHDTGRNIFGERLPECARLIHGWSGHPYSMVQELDDSFAAAAFIGYHSRAGSENNPLAHTMTTRVALMTINGMPASEFMLHSYAAATFGVPVVFVSGDQGLCNDVAEFNPGVKTLAVSKGVGASTISMAPSLAQRLIREGVEEAVSRNRDRARLKLPSHFTLEITYAIPTQAYKAAWYPGAEHVRDNTVRLDAANFFDIMRMLRFVL